VKYGRHNSDGIGIPFALVLDALESAERARIQEGGIESPLPPSSLLSGLVSGLHEFFLIPALAPLPILEQMLGP
jgi:hypothetical protein